jgi:hypothetical protein
MSGYNDNFSNIFNNLQNILTRKIINLFLTSCPDNIVQNVNGKDWFYFIIPILTVIVWILSVLKDPCVKDLVPSFMLLGVVEH